MRRSEKIAVGLLAAMFYVLRLFAMLVFAAVMLSVGLRFLNSPPETVTVSGEEQPDQNIRLEYAEN